MATQETIKQLLSGGVLRDIEDVTARQAITALQNALDALTGEDTTTAIENFQEVIDFLAGVTDDATLIGKITELQTAINSKQATLTFDNTPTANSNNVVKSGGVKAALDNKVDKVTGYGLSKNDYNDTDKAAVATIGNKANASDVYPKSQTYTKSEVQTAIEEAIEGMPTGDIPEKVSDLTNDLGFITAAALVDVVAGNGDFAMTYDDNTDTYNIVRLVPTINVSDDSLSFDSTSKTKTITISGTNLKADISITAPSGWTASVNSLAQTNGVVAETQVTLTYGGSDDSTATGDLVLSAGTASKTVPLSYTQYGGPTITVSPASLSFEAVGGQSQQKTATVGKFNIEGEVSVAVSGTDASKFSASLSGSTLTVTYTPGNVNSGSHSATVTLSATGATSKTLSVSGSVLAQSLTITPASLSLESDNGVAATGTINVKGTNIVDNVALAISGSGFSLSANSLAAADVNSANGVDVTVTANIASGTTASATITASSGQASASASAEWIKTEPDPAVNDVVERSGLKYKVTSVADGNTHGKVTLICKDTSNQYSVKYNKASIVVPTEITIASKQYDVAALGSPVSYADTVLTSIDLSGATHLATIATNAFFNCTNVESDLIFPDSVTKIESNSFAFTKPNTVKIGNGVSYTKFDDYTNLGTIIAANNTNHAYPKVFDFGTGITAVGHAQKNCTGYTTLILRCNQVATIAVGIASTALEHIYVPANLVASYKADSNWSSRESIIEAIPNELL